MFAVLANMPLLLQGTAQAAALQSRSIQLSSSTAGATGTTYTVSFNWATTGNIQGIVIDFCDDSPTIGTSTCTLPAGFSITAAPAVSGQSSTAGGNLTTFTSASQLNTNRTLVLTAASPVAMTEGFTSSFNLTTVTNPNTANDTFYARVYTYATSAAAAAYTAANTGTFVDAGGLALSTAAQISTSFDVPESVSFCVYTGANCAAGIASGIALGDTNGILSSTGPFVDKTTKYDIATNAGGATPSMVIRIKGPLPTYASNTLPSIGTSGTGSATGTSQFGICSYRETGSELTIVAPYNNSSTSGGICSGTTQTAGTGSTGGNNSALFAFDTANISSTYGDDFATINDAATNTGRLVFIGNTSTSQRAGLYTATYNLVATGTY